VGDRIAKRYVVRGRVQGVGFRAFVQESASSIGIAGWVRNLDDGTVEVYATGPAEKVGQLEDSLWRGPRWSEVRGVNTREDTIDSGVTGFRIR
jgi:acylphosphatase